MICVSLIASTRCEVLIGRLLCRRRALESDHLVVVVCVSALRGLFRWNVFFLLLRYRRRSSERLPLAIVATFPFFSHGCRKGKESRAGLEEDAFDARLRGPRLARPSQNNTTRRTAREHCGKPVPAGRRIPTRASRVVSAREDGVRDFARHQPRTVRCGQRRSRSVPKGGHRRSAGWGPSTPTESEIVESGSRHVGYF